MQPPAHRPPTPWQIERARICKSERELFFQNLDLILAHEADILKCNEYFFCRPVFAGYGIICFNSHINLGTLLLGWRQGILMDRCYINLGARKAKYSCYDTSYVYHFGGMGSGTGWTGFCRTCGGSKRRYDNRLTWERVAFVSSANDQFKDWVEGLELEHFPSQKFSFGEPAVVPATAAMMRRTKLSLLAPVPVAGLIEELQAGNIRKPTPPDRTLLKDCLIVMRNGKETERVTLIKQP